MKVVINSCYGGFSISPKAVKWIAEKNGRKCYFYDYHNGYKLIDEKQGTGKNSLFVMCFDVDNINDILPKEHGFGEIENNRKFNEIWKKHNLSHRPDDRTDPVLIECIEALGSDANGSYAELKIVEIPEGIDWHISEYDGYETIEENHRSWG